MNKPFAESCEQNKEPILSVLKPLLNDKNTVLEIGSGTGQHAVYFSQQLPHITWQPSEQETNIPGINLWIEEFKLDNVNQPFVLDVNEQQWPGNKYDAVFTANTLHILHWKGVESFFLRVISKMNNNGLLIIYGPFNYNYQYTSESNARFDAWLKDRDPGSGIRNFEELNTLAEKQGLCLFDDYAMPQNNRILCWQLKV